MNMISATPSFCGKIKLRGDSYFQIYDKDRNLIKDENEQARIIKSYCPEAEFRPHTNQNPWRERGQAIVINNVIDAKDITEIDREKYVIKMPAGYIANVYHSSSYKCKTDYQQVLGAYNAACQNDYVTVSLGEDRK